MESVLNKLTVIVTNHNQKEVLINTLGAIVDIPEISDLVVIDNFSADGSADFIAELGCNFISFDEGLESWGRIWNTVIDNFPVKEYILFIDAGYILDKDSILQLIEVLKDDKTGVCSPLFNGSIFPKELKEVNLMVKGLYADVLAVNGECFAVRKDVIESNERFDEMLVFPENVCKDYSFRLLEAGYRNRLCERAFTDYVGTPYYTDNSEAGARDRKILKEKYGMNYFNIAGNPTLVGAIKRKKDEAFSVLEVGCDMGATLLEIQRSYPNAIVKGLEINEAAVSIGSLLCDIKVGNIEKLTIPFDENEKFDYIIFGDVLEHLHNTEEVVSYCKTILNPGGRIIASIPNLMHISVMKQLINGIFPYSDAGLLDRTHIHFFTYYEIMNMFNGCGYEVEDISGIRVGITTQEDAKLIELLVSLSDSTQGLMYESYQYLVIAKRK